MKHLTVSCFVSLILATNAWMDYSDYYNYDVYNYFGDLDLLNSRREVSLGSKVSLGCNVNLSDVRWRNNGELYYAFVYREPITNWLNKGIVIKINSKNDTGIWDCYKFTRKVKSYNVTLITKEAPQSSEPKTYRYPTHDLSTSTTKIPWNTFTTVSHQTSTERSSTPVSCITDDISLHSTTAAPSASSANYPTIPHEVTKLQVSTTGKPVKKTKLLETEPSSLAFLIDKELSYSLDNPFFKLKSKTMAKSSAIQATVSSVILLLLVKEMLICLLRI